MNAGKWKGFTLTELLVVIAIIGMLASILAPALKSVKVKAIDAACRAEIRDIERGCRDFYEDFGFYPPDTFGTSYNTYVTTTGQRAINWMLSPLLRGCPGRTDLLRTPDDITGPETSSILMVFFLGSEFTIGGRSFGPYYEFRKDQLDPHPDAANWHGERYPASGVANGSGTTYGSYGCRSTAANTIAWSIRGVEDDNPGADVRLYRYLDKFGPPRRGNFRYFDYYIYDCHYPEGWQIYGPEPQPPDHNMGFVDISCYGFDGNTSVNVAEEDMPGGGDGEEGATPPGDQDDVQGRRGVELRGMWKDDVNNWTDSNVWPWKSYGG